MRKFAFCIKRMVDVLASGVGLLILSPLLAIVMAIIKITMPGPIFFKQERVGKDMKIFYILKFRTMKVDPEAEAIFNTNRDQERITKVGWFLRRTKIDELPQLLNVLIGDMSLVGPRPTFKKQVDNYTQHQMRRLTMMPGMTGLAQINGNTSLSWDERIEYDIEYVNSFSIILDLKILLKTVAIVLLGEARFKRAPVVKPGKTIAKDTKLISRSDL